MHEPNEPTRLIPLRRRNQVVVAHAIVDGEDFARLNTSRSVAIDQGAHRVGALRREYDEAGEEYDAALVATIFSHDRVADQRLRRSRRQLNEAHRRLLDARAELISLRTAA